MVMIGGDTECGPSHRAGDDQLGGGVHGCHNELLPPLQRGLAPLVAIACPTTRNAGDRKGKGKGHMRGVPIGSEADTSARENRDGGQWKVRARFPCFPNPKGSVVRDDIAGSASARAITTVSAIAANQAIQARRDSFDGIHGTDKDPDLNHVSGLAVFAGGFEARRDDHAVAVFVEDKSVHRTPPFKTVNRTLRPVVSLRPEG